MCSEKVPPSVDNIEEFDWTYCSFDLKAFWAALQIQEETFTNSTSSFEASSAFGDLDRDSMDERILR